MSDDFHGRIDDQLRRAGEHWRAHRPVGAPVDRSLFVEQDEPKRSWRPAMASAAGALTLLVVGVLIVLSLPPADPDVASGSPSPSSADSTPAPTTSARPSLASVPLPVVDPEESITVDGVVWHQFGSAGLPEGIERFDSVTVVDGRFIAGVHRCSGSQPCEFLHLESLDGASWRIAGTIAPEIDPRSEIRFFPDREVGLVAVAGLLHSGPRPGLWLSADGTTWDLVGDQPVFDVPECERIDSFEVFNVYRASSHLVAQGRIYCGPTIYRRTWISSDGRTWSAAEYVPASYVVERDGSFVGLADSVRYEDIIGYSDDGLTWERALESDMELTVAPVADGFVALGRREGNGERAVTLTSADGASWAEHPDPLPPLIFGGLHSDGSRAAFMPNMAREPAVWISSPDGLSWSEHRLPDSFGEDAADVAILGDRLVVFSYNAPRYWLADLAQP